MMVLVAVSDADPLAHFARLHRWLRGNTIPLGFYAEHWKPTPAHRGTERLRELGHHPADTEWHITSQLINGVIHAAGGVEYAASKLTAALDADEAYLDEFAPELKEPQSYPIGFAWRNRDVANYEFANLLLWLKTLKERLKNQDDRGGDFGLLAALADDEPWTVGIGQLYERLNNSGAFAYHRIANFVTHIGPAPQPFGTFSVVDRRLVLLIPDPPKRPVYTWAELTYGAGHDARTFATAALDAVEEFIDGMLTAFEEAKIEIERRRASIKGPERLT